jgi:hypothetical protein
VAIHSWRNLKAGKKRSALSSGKMRMNMPNRRSEVLVTEFLRDALAVDPLGVPELEARARATGLLGEGQSITHIKVFKRAKKSLGIRSLRAGFGVSSGSSSIYSSLPTS